MSKHYILTLDQGSKDDFDRMAQPVNILLKFQHLQIYLRSNFVECDNLNKYVDI